jgi:hypothetical protein
LHQRLTRLLARRLFSNLAGMSAGDWLRLLWDNNCAVEVPYVPRAVLVSLSSLPSSIDRWREDRRYGAALAGVRVRPPLFVLGHWRTGTTHLHNLLSADPQFAYPNLVQVFHPHTFLLSEDRLARFLAPWLPKRRLMDEVVVGIETPQEDEFALAVSTRLSPYLAWAFPRRWAHYERYLTFRGVARAEVERWKAGLLLFLKKLTFKYDRPLVLKSPPHTGRVRLLLELFPEARFVHIHRDPYTVFQSTQHLELAATSTMGLQRASPHDLSARILRRYQTMYDCYLEERALIAPIRLHEVAFEALAHDPLGEMANLYAVLGLPNFAAARPALQAHLRTVKDYRRNEYAPLGPAERLQVARAWGRFFDVWGYRA